MISCGYESIMCGGQIRDRATVIQQKTGRLVQFEVTDQTRAAIRDWLANTAAWNSQYLFPSRFHSQPHISTRQYARIVHRWVERAGFASSAYGTHSLRTLIQHKCGPVSGGAAISSFRRPSSARTKMEQDAPIPAIRVIPTGRTG